VLVQGDRFAEVVYGDKVSVTGTLKAPQSFVTDFGREFNYPGYLKARGIEYYVSYAEIEVVGQGLGNSFLSWLLFKKQLLMSGIEMALAEPQAGLGEGLLLGVKQALGSDLEEAFRVSGIVHIVVLSGYNIMLIMTFILFIGSYVMSRRPRLLVALGAVTCFALLVGLSATVVRASIMVSLLIVAQLLGRSYHVMRALCLAAVVMVAINPYLLMYDIGFQLSFMATLGLLVILPSLELYTGKTLSAFGIKEFLLSTIATQIAVLPLLIYHVGQVSLIAIVVNVLVLPVVPLAMLATFGAGLLALLLPAVAIPFAFIAYLALSYIITIATTFAALPFAAVVMPPLSPWWIPLLYGVIVLLWYRLMHVQKEYSIVDDWEIVEEETLVKKADESQSASSADNLPIFFR
jgi:competence protein ComEC